VNNSNVKLSRRILELNGVHKCQVYAGFVNLLGKNINLLPSLFSCYVFNVQNLNSAQFTSVLFVVSLSIVPNF
jgi:hypothetical protein